MRLSDSIGIFLCERCASAVKYPFCSGLMNRMMEERPSADEVLLIGKVIDAFGLRGEIKIRAITDQVDHLRRHVRTVFLGDRKSVV